MQRPTEHGRSTDLGQTTLSCAGLCEGAGVGPATAGLHRRASGEGAGAAAATGAGGRAAGAPACASAAALAWCCLVRCCGMAAEPYAAAAHTHCMCSAVVAGAPPTTALLVCRHAAASPNLLPLPPHATPSPCQPGGGPVTPGGGLPAAGRDSGAHRRLLRQQHGRLPAVRRIRRGAGGGGVLPGAQGARV